jgi:hypothetical protein
MERPRHFGFVVTRPKDLTIVQMTVVVTICNFCAETKSAYGNVAKLVIGY